VGAKDRPRILTELSDALYARYLRVGDKADLEHAIDLQQEALTLTPERSPVRAVSLYNLGRALQSRWRDSHHSADEQQARLAYQQAIDSGHADAAPMAAVGLGTLLEEKGDSAAAKATFQRAIDSGHADAAPQAALDLGNLLAALGETSAAQAAFQRAIDSGHTVVASLAEVELAKLTGKKPPEPSADRAKQRFDTDRQEETAPTLTDNPAVVDELERESLAKVLATRIRSMRQEEIKAAGHSGEFPHGRSFLLHIQGRWGAGKTSLLNFLREELHKPPPTSGGPKAKPWVVVSFNAWEHQRIAPPWWWLMSTIYHQGFHELWHVGRHWDAVLFRLREWAWRARGGWPGYAMMFAALVLLVVIWKTGLYKSLTSPKTSLYETIKAIALGIVAILTPILTIWGAIRSGNRWLLTKSARAARTFVDNTRDPMQIVKEHFAELTGWAYPVAILIDDLDRCKSSYVIELLEGIQTLFRDVPVTYVVAADRDWLSDCYEAEYGDFVSSGGAPGRPLGYLFLEKTFQLSAIVPALSKEVHTDYWVRLINGPSSINREELERARREAAGKFAGTRTEEEVWSTYANDPGSTPAQQQATVEAMAIQLCTPRFQRETEHALRPFAPLLDSNPRAMKRLVNAYGIVRDIETLNKHRLGDRLAQQQTALWVILQLRWPKFAEHIKRHPEQLEELKKGVTPTNAPEDLKGLFSEGEVKKVVLGEAEGVEAQLDSDYINHQAI
jgi:tetratricopeptide (TPR) repeat protein